MNQNTFVFYNQILDKKGTKKILSWFLDQYGPSRTSQFLEELKILGFHFATVAGLSLGFDDLKIPRKKASILKSAEENITECEQNFHQGKITAVERYQKVIMLWTTASENLKDEVIQYFQQTDLFNPLYMMAFSGARGNISQVRQLVGMRGLMSDSAGGIIDFPIRRNFREGLTVTEYAISCYGARKGLIDTALRTADSGYLTRRLVDVAHGIMIGQVECGTQEGFEISPLRTTEKAGSESILLSLEKRILGRVLAQNVPASGSPRNPKFVGSVNQEITPLLASEIIQSLAEGKKKESSSGNRGQVLLIRSPLTCKHFQNFREDICQLCYGWSLAQSRLVSLGEAVGILAAQSIGEPGTQLTMRTFHTGGIFSTDVDAKIFAPHDGIVSFARTSEKTVLKGKKIRTFDGQTGFFLFEQIQLKISVSSISSIFSLPAQSIVFVYPGQKIRKNSLCAEISHFLKTDPFRKTTENPELGKFLRFADPGQSEILANKMNLSTIHPNSPSLDELLLPREALASPEKQRNLEQIQALDIENEVFHQSVDDSVPDLSSDEGVQNIQTKKVVSEIEGQVYFSTQFSPPQIKKRTGCLWILNGKSIQLNGSETFGLVKSGDFFRIKEKQENFQSDTKRLRLSNTQNILQKSPIDSFKWNTHSSKILGEKNVWIPCVGQKEHFIELNNLNKFKPVQSVFVFSENISLKEKKKDWDSFSYFRETQGKTISKNRIRKKEKNFFLKPIQKIDKIPETQTQALFRSVNKGIVNYLEKCASSSAGKAETQKPLQLQIPQSKILKVFRFSSCCFDIKKLEATNKESKFFEFSQDSTPEKKLVLSFELLNANRRWVSEKKKLPFGILKITNLRKGENAQKERDPGILKILKNRHNLGEFRNSQVRNSISTAEQKTQKNLLIQGNHLRKLQVSSVSKVSSQLGEFFQSTKILGWNTLSSKKPDEKIRTDKNVQIFMRFSSKYSACLENPNSENVKSSKGSFLVIRRIHPYLISKHSNVSVQDGDIVEPRQFLFELFFEKSKTGDIVQGLPKIEQLFESRRTSLHVQESIHKKLKQKYLDLTQTFSCFEATRQSLRFIQRILIDEIQTVYQSQGVDIADKHLEIIVRQMTSKVIVHEKGNTSFFPGDIVDFYKIQNLFDANSLDSELIMEPIVLGITKVAFLTESFISAASFQEAKRVLMYCALESRIDFLYGLKENVIVGRFIRAGTGFRTFVFPNLSTD
jgi:hypothetical protein